MHFTHISILSAGHEPGGAGWGWMSFCHKSDPTFISWVGNNSQRVLIFRKETMWIEAHCTLHGGLACSRRDLLWAGVTGRPSPDRMDLSVKPYNLQVRKPFVCIGGPWLYNRQRVIVLYVRSVFCIIQASPPTHDHVVPEGAAAVCAAVQWQKLLLRAWGCYRLHGTTVVKERERLP